MLDTISLLNATRQNILTVIQNLSADQLNRVPAGFNNNLIWNAGHVLVTQQLLYYKLSQRTPHVEEATIERYRRGTKPEGRVAQKEIDYIRQRLIETVALAEQDIAQDIFQSFHPYTTTFGMELKSIEDAMHFNNLHETLHLGYMMAQKRLVT